MITMFFMWLTDQTKFMKGKERKKTKQTNKKTKGKNKKQNS